MNAYNAISLVYGLMALAAISVLYFTFRNKFDVSGKLFLLAEVSALPTVLIINLAHADQAYKNSLLILISNAAYLLSEIFICFSIYALGRRIRRRTFIMSLFAASVFCGAAELLRWRDPYLPSLIYPFGFALIAFATMRICAASKIPGLKDNPFFNWIRYIEAALLTISVIRVTAYFVVGPITPFDSNASAAIFFTIMATVNISRYISYQSLRISWVDPSGVRKNFLNQSLAQTAQEKERLVENLISSNRILGISALASSLAHQLSQPLTSAALHSETIKRDLTSAGVDVSFIIAMNKVTRELNTLSDLVRNLRQLFAVKTENFRPFSLREMSDEILELVSATRKTKSVSFNKDYQSDPMVHGNPVQIQQVMINIIDNAIEAIDLAWSARREIRIVIGRTDKFACLTIEDNGAGIHNDILPVIFDLYKTTKSDGLGIGLWLSKTIIDNHQGTITAANKPGGGAIFEIRLPLEQQTQ